MPIPRRLLPAGALFCSLSVAGCVVWSAQRNAALAPDAPEPAPRGLAPAHADAIHAGSPTSEPVFLTTSKSAGMIPQRPPPATVAPADEPAPIFLPSSKVALPLSPSPKAQRASAPRLEHVHE